MTNFSYDPEMADRGELVRAGIATALLAATFVFSVFFAGHDVTKTVAGTPCSVLSEVQISAVLSAPMRLLSTEGGACRYMSIDDRRPRTLLVRLRKGTSPKQPSFALTSSDFPEAAARKRDLAALLGGSRIAQRR